MTSIPGSGPPCHLYVKPLLLIQTSALLAECGSPCLPLWKAAFVQCPKRPFVIWPTFLFLSSVSHPTTPLTTSTSAALTSSLFLGHSCQGRQVHLRTFVLTVSSFNTSTKSVKASENHTELACLGYMSMWLCKDTCTNGHTCICTHSGGLRIVSLKFESRWVSG